LADARGTLRELLVRFPGTQLVAQARYWMARCAQLQGSGQEAAQGYKEVIPLFPGSFYAAVAAERLRELKEEPPAGFPSPPKERKGDPPLKELALARALSEAGLLRDASEEVSWQIAHVRTAAQALLFGHALASLGEFGAAHSLAARQLWGAAYGSKEAEALALFYPRAFQLSVEANAKREALDPFLVWAIMRRESGYRSEVLSAANARGLMQLIPPTAAAIAKELALPSPNPDELFSPDLNIRMGSWYLAKLLERFRHPALVAAAYNAGPTAAVRWVKEKGDLPLDLFVEIIPFKETRGYVKQVVADYLTYHALYGGSSPHLALSIPSPSDAGVNF
jgi:soluble lytic murein transglycosylase